MIWLNRAAILITLGIVATFRFLIETKSADPSLSFKQLLALEKIKSLVPSKRPAPFTLSLLSEDKYLDGSLLSICETFEHGFTLCVPGVQNNWKWPLVTRFTSNTFLAASDQFDQGYLVVKVDFLHGSEYLGPTSLRLSNATRHGLGNPRIENISSTEADLFTFDADNMLGRVENSETHDPNTPPHLVHHWYICGHKEFHIPKCRRDSLACKTEREEISRDDRGWRWPRTLVWKEGVDSPPDSAHCVNVGVKRNLI